MSFKKPYFQKVPLIEELTQLSSPLIPLFSGNMGIRVNKKEAT